MSVHIKNIWKEINKRDDIWKSAYIAETEREAPAASLPVQGCSLLTTFRRLSATLKVTMYGGAFPESSERFLFSL